MSLININNTLVFDTSEYRLFKAKEDRKSVKIVDKPAVKKWLFFTASPELSHTNEFTEYVLIGHLKTPKTLSAVTHTEKIKNGYYDQIPQYKEIPVYRELIMDEEEIFRTQDKALFVELMTHINSITDLKLTS